MPILYNPYKKKGVFMIPAGGLGPSVSADFSYSKSSYHQGEANPTPTITGTPGGSFVCTSGAVFVDTGSTSSSTGQIDLDASTIDTHLISYTVDSVTATANVGITASPFLINNFSMQFDAASSQYVNVGTTLGNQLGNSYTGDITVSMWFNADTVTSDDGLFTIKTGSSFGNITFLIAGSTVRMYYNNDGTFISSSVSINQWYHLVGVLKAGDASNTKLYLNGSAVATATTTPSSSLNFSGMEAWIGNYFAGNNAFDGKIDEVALWNTALSADAVTEIYNATANNTGKVLDLNTDSGNYTSSANLTYWNRLGD